MSTTKRDLIGIFVHHRVAANLLMIMMLLSGVFALLKLNVQFFPTANLEIITVRVVWSGASAEDIENGITTPLEQRLKSVDGINKITSTSAQGISSLTLEFEEDTDMLFALDEVRREVDGYRNLPADAEDPEIVKVTFPESIAEIMISGTSNMTELRNLAHRFESELLSAGIDKIDILGLPDEQISIEVPSATLNDLQLSLDDIANKVSGFSQDIPAGTIGDAVAGKELRSLDQRRNENQFAQIPLVSNNDRYIRLGDVAEIKREAIAGSFSYLHEGEPVVLLRLKRAEGGNTLTSAQILQDWYSKTVQKLPPNIKLTLIDERWQSLRGRIMLLLENGLSGLALVILILYIFLTGRVAFWVAVGIPTSFMATLFVLLIIGGSINMVSLFALIMALGIIVDDAIVVGEDALAHYQMGEASMHASEGGAKRMLAPVMASSLTTISAFLPLMMIGDIIGKILIAIPMIIVCVILASVIESFLILPGHLRHAFHHEKRSGHHSQIRDRLDAGFNFFRDRLFRPLISRVLRYRAVTLALAIAFFMATIGLVTSGRIQFTFFPSPESNIIVASASFVAGTPKARVQNFLTHIEQALKETEASFDSGKFIKAAIVRQGFVDTGGRKGDHLGSINVELVQSEERDVRNEPFIKAWKERIRLAPGIEYFTIEARRSGPPGKDVQIRLTGNTAEVLKQAANSLVESLKGINGVMSVTDDLAYGREQLIYRLSPAGESLELSVAEIGSQLRTAFDGQLVQIYQDGYDEVEVRVSLPRDERYHPATLQRFQVKTPSGDFVSLSSVATWESQRGFEALRHADGFLATEVQANVDNAVANSGEINESLANTILPDLVKNYGVNYSFEGRAKESRDTLSDMRTGAIFGLILMYLILAWVFSSYGLPFVVLFTIPFGIIGAIVGHYMMGLDLTILSISGMFGLSGIVVNDSIILVTFFKILHEKKGIPVQEALIEAACQRLRAVLLTSLTTIAGLTPLLFETSLQAQFLIPMATSIAFGLGFATFLILFVVPSFLSFYMSIISIVKPSAVQPQGVLASEAT